MATREEIKEEMCEQSYCHLPKGHDGLHKATARIYDIEDATTKQEEIREGLYQVLNDLYWACECAAINPKDVDDILNYLHSKRCRIEVDRELPKTTHQGRYAYEDSQRDMLKWHNDSLEPLIEEITNDQTRKTIYKRVKCPDCKWSQFQDEVVGMTPCDSCISTGYIFEPLIADDTISHDTCDESDTTFNPNVPFTYTQ